MPSFSTSKSGDIEDTPSETGTAMSELSRASSTTRRSIFHTRNPLHKVQKMLGRKSSSSLSMSAVAKISESPTPSEGPTEEATPPSTEPTSRMDPEEEVTPPMERFARPEETPVVVKKEMNALEKIGSFLSGGEKKEEEATTEAAPPPEITDEPSVTKGGIMQIPIIQKIMSMHEQPAAEPITPTTTEEQAGAPAPPPRKSQGVTYSRASPKALPTEGAVANPIVQLDVLKSKVEAAAAKMAPIWWKQAMECFCLPVAAVQKKLE